MEAEVTRVAITPLSSVQHGRSARGVPPVQQDKGRAVHLPFILVALAILLGAEILICTTYGAVHIPLHALWHTQSLTETQHIILFTIRLPRVLASAVVGAALAVSGLMFQGLFRNPMADPYIIGSSGGAVVGGCIGILFLSQLTIFGFSATALLAFLGSVLTMGVVYSLARARGRTNVVTLLLAGFAMSTMLSNSTYVFEIFDPNPASGTRALNAWLHGIIGIPHWSQLGVTTGILVFSMFAAYPLMRQLNTLSLGDEYAHHLGIRVEYTRLCIILVASLLTAAAVSLGGLISFAGLIVPHVARLFLGPDHVRLLPVTALAGAIFLVLTDTFARTLFAPTELPVGVLMVFLGGPFFLYLLRKSKREYVL
ncbi:iron complex transport system permease protein [Granulicella pectinivorans]|uniref:Iron complex transport system permease protein n=1 Tax=Granulicella pectinivorans TaxID=474950 RepID=A0A1I6MRF4_9BACT|nr:iron ABC transporter permease [Granulicella pectinivorans]SFS18098.1 iron complex transport system permease protein [Granulicella pectinivorans]